METRPKHTPIFNLGTLNELSRNSFGIVAIFPGHSEPELRPDHPNSPVINAGQGMVQEK